MINWVWRKKKATESKKDEPIIVEDSDFSTDLTSFRKLRESQKAQWINENAFKRTVQHIDKVNRHGESVAFDSAFDSNVKSTFSAANSSAPLSLLSWYVQQGFIGYQSCSIIAQNWLVDRACSVPPKDALKKGYEITVNGDVATPEEIEKLRSFDKRFKLSKKLIEFEKFNRVFGIRIALFDIDSQDDDYYLKPFNLDGIKKGSYKGIVQVDPYWISPELDQEASANPASLGFYEPTWWRINGKRYHKSHLIITVFSEVSDVLKPSYYYGGIPLTQMIYERVYSAERTANEAPIMALTKRTNIIKTDAKRAIANQSDFEERLNLFNSFRDNHGVLAIDKNEEYQQSDTALTDLDVTIMTQYQLVAAVANMPATKLIGTSPKGFNATGESEQANYYDMLETIQEDSFTPLLERHYQILMRSEGLADFEFDVTWDPLKSMTAKEKAEIREIDSRTDTNHINNGAVSPDEARERIASDEDSGYNGIEAYEEVEFTEE